MNEKEDLLATAVFDKSIPVTENEARALLDIINSLIGTVDSLWKGIQKNVVIDPEFNSEMEHYLKIMRSFSSKFERPR